MNPEQEIAKLLLEIKAVSLNVHEPFRYTSGIISPIYTDNRLIISYPDKRKIIIEAFLDLIKREKLVFDVVAGTATAGIPHAAWISNALEKPMVYVRAKAKEHGKQNQIEGHLEKNQRAIVIEDLISTGKSSIAAAEALRESGGIVDDCLAIFTYGLPTALSSFTNAKVKCHALTNFQTLLETAVTLGYINQQEMEIAQNWNKNPSKWQAA
jgi:orotate phosphoribosyltransferase